MPSHCSGQTVRGIWTRTRRENFPCRSMASTTWSRPITPKCGIRRSWCDLNNCVKAKTSYPHISQNRSILGGVPIISGTRTPVRSIAGYYQMGMTVDEILQALPHLTAGQVHAALGYYFDHQKDIDRDMARNSDLEHWKKVAGKL